MRKEELQEIVQESLQELNEQMPEENRVVFDGSGVERIDSLTLTSLVFILERRLQERVGGGLDLFLSFPVVDVEKGALVEQLVIWLQAQDGLGDEE